MDSVAIAFRPLAGESARIKALVDKLSIGSQEQSRSVEQVTKSLAQIEQVTQRSAAAEESSAAAEELTAQAASLDEVGERLTAMIGGRA